MTYADESGDACVFTRKLAEAAAARGVEFKFNTTVVGLDQSNGHISGLRARTADGDYVTIRAEFLCGVLGLLQRDPAQAARHRSPYLSRKGLLGDLADP